MHKWPFVVPCPQPFDLEFSSINSGVCTYTHMMMSVRRLKGNAGNSKCFERESLSVWPLWKQNHFYFDYLPFGFLSNSLLLFRISLSVWSGSTWLFAQMTLESGANFRVTNQQMGLLKGRLESLIPTTRVCQQLLLFFPFTLLGSGEKEAGLV